MTPSPETIAELKAKHAGKQLHMLEFDDGESAVIAIQPPASEWNRLVTVTATDKARSGAAIEDFARSCIVWPERAALMAIASERPALLSRFGSELADLAGASEKITAKKL